MDKITVKTTAEDKGQRLDKVLALHAEGLSRARLQALLEQGQISSNGVVINDASRKVKGDEEYEIIVPPAEEATPRPQNIPLDIVFEDDDLLVINKSPDMVVHPAVGNFEGTLVNALLAHCADTLSGVGGVKRPGIVHRLDKETSGLMVVAKNDAAHQGLSAQLSSRTLKRVYKTVVWGQMSPMMGRIETNMGRSRTNRKKMTVLAEGGKDAITDYQVLQHFGVIASLVECRLQSGRTHQIRVHMAHMKHHVLGDPVYGKTSPAKFLKLHKTPDKTADILLAFDRQALHAAQLEFIHPISDNKMSFAADLPKDMQDLLKALEQYSKKVTQL